MEEYKIIVVGLVAALVVLVVVVLWLAYRVGQKRKADQERMRLIEEANDTQQKFIYLLKSRSA